MPRLPRRAAKETTAQRIERSAGELATAATKHLETHLDWYPKLSANERSWVGVVAQAGIASFIAWYTDPSYRGRTIADVFGAAPKELTGVITLSQTLDLVRCVVDAVEANVADLAIPGDEAEVHLAVLRYSREVAFAAAQVYADAAESRGAWDARLESLVVDAVLRGEADDELSSRATTLGWGEVTPVTVVAATAPASDLPFQVEQVRRGAARAGAECLVAVQGRRVVLILGGTSEPGRVADGLLPYLGDGPVVIGPSVPHLFAAGRSARAAISGYRASVAVPDLGRPCSADDLLPERALSGEGPARRTLIDRIYRPLATSGGELLDTVEAYLRCGRSLEATSRALFVHTNTVRYRLGRVEDLLAYDVTSARDAFVVQVALVLGRLEAAGAVRRRDRESE